MRKMISFTGIMLFLCSLGSQAFADDDPYLAASWSYRPNTYVNKVSVADLNGDGAAEVIASTRDGIVYNLGTKFKGHLNWQVLMGGDIRAFKVLDYDGDGKKEVLIGADSAQNNIKLVEWQGLNKGSSIDFEQRIYSIDSDDVDGDGVKDIVVGSSDGGVYLYKSGEKEAWKYLSRGPVYYVHASGREIIAASTWAGEETDGAEVYALDSDGGLEWAHDIEGGIYSPSSTVVAVSDLNGDGKGEVIIGTSKKGIEVIGPDGLLLWNYPTERLVSSVYLAELSGKRTVLAGSMPYVYALDEAGRLLWRFPVNTTVYSMHTGDIDSDGRPEIILGANKYLHILAEDGKLIASQNRGVEIVGFGKEPVVKNVDARSVYSGDVDGDGREDVVVGYGWTESRLDSNYYLGEVSVYDVNDKYVKAAQEEQPASTSTSSIKQSTAPSTSSTSSPGIKSTTLLQAPAAATTTTQAVRGETDGETPWPAMVLLLLAALLISVAIIFLLSYRKGRPKDVSLSWPQGQDI